MYFYKHFEIVKFEISENFTIFQKILLLDWSIYINIKMSETNHTLKNAAPLSPLINLQKRVIIKFI